MLNETEDNEEDVFMDAGVDLNPPPRDGPPDSNPGGNTFHFLTLCQAR